LNSALFWLMRQLATIKNPTTTKITVPSRMEKNRDDRDCFLIRWYFATIE
jgi:hypothetical protein